MRYENYNYKPIKNKNNKPLAVILDPKTGEKQYYRAYNCIENSISYGSNCLHSLYLYYNSIYIYHLLAIPMK